MDQLRTNGLIGSDVVRVDGLFKVTGRAVYGADQPAPGAAHAVVITSPIARGCIESIDDSAAKDVIGVCDILTYKNVGDLVQSGRGAPGKHESGYMSQAYAPLSSPEIRFGGQIVAVVIADTAEIATEAAERLKITFRSEPPAGSMTSVGAEEVEAFAPLGETEISAGDTTTGFAAAAAIVDEWYETPPNHHSPMELFQTTCAWSEDGEHLTVHESSQNVRGFQHGLALQLGIDPGKVRIISPYIGGGFGSRGRLGQYTALVALAARRLRRPVKFVATRSDCFTLKHFRAETRHHLRLGADREGHLVALDHQSWELVSRDDTFAVAGSDVTCRLYACPNVRTLVKTISTDRQGSGFMRGPAEVPYMFAMESAMDELAHQLKIDPVDFRRRNETSVDLVSRRPYSSRSLLQCMEKGSELFRWPERNPRIGSHSTAAEHVGWGYATAVYPVQIASAGCTITLMDGPRARVETSTHEIGNGMLTVLTQTTADLLGLPLDCVEARIGDSALPCAPLAAGSSSTASVCSVVVVACENLRKRLAESAIACTTDPCSPLAGLSVDSIYLANGALVSGNVSEPLSVAIRRTGLGEPIVEKSWNMPQGMTPEGDAKTREGKPSFVGGTDMEGNIQFSFGAHFVEVRINRFTQMIHVSRMVGVFAAGRIMNSRTAWAQLNGAQIWGISSASHEETIIDPQYARYINQDLSEYLMPVAADIGNITTVMLPEVDTTVNPLGIKGIGELGSIGVNAAIANAIFHATGHRHRSLPFHVGDLPFDSLPLSTPTESPVAEGMLAHV